MRRPSPASTASSAIGTTSAPHKGGVEGVAGADPQGFSGVRPQRARLRGRACRRCDVPRLAGVPEAHRRHVGRRHGPRPHPRLRGQVHRPASDHQGFEAVHHDRRALAPHGDPARKEDPGHRLFRQGSRRQRAGRTGGDDHGVRPRAMLQPRAGPQCPGHGKCRLSERCWFAACEWAATGKVGTDRRVGQASAAMPAHH